MTKAEMVSAIGNLAQGQAQILELMKAGSKTEVPVSRKEQIKNEVKAHVEKGGKVTKVAAKTATKPAKKEKSIPDAGLLNGLAAYFGDADYTGYSKAEGDDADVPTVIKFSGGSLRMPFYLPLV